MLTTMFVVYVSSQSICKPNFCKMCQSILKYYCIGLQKTDRWHIGMLRVWPYYRQWHVILISTKCRPDQTICCRVMMS